MEANLAAARLTNLAAKFVGAAVNTAALDDAGGATTKRVDAKTRLMQARLERETYGIEGKNRGVAHTAEIDKLPGNVDDAGQGGAPHGDCSRAPSRHCGADAARSGEPA